MARAIFYHPPIENIPLLTVPLAYLHLATPLRSSRHQLLLVDGRVEAEPVEALTASLADADALLVTCMPGSQIQGALAACRTARELRPDLPILWGGAHPSVDPGGTLANELLSAVVVGRGEHTLGAILDAIDAGTSLGEIPNVWARESDGEIRKGATQPVVHQPPTPPRFDLLESVEPYICETRRSRRMLDYISSFGCPHRCTFCSEPVTSQSVWSPMPAATLVDEIAALVERYQLDGILFEDAKFSARTDRLVDFCQGLLDRRVEVNWIATACSTDLKVFHDKGILDLMRRSGCEQIFIGAEAASPETLKKYKKVVDGDGTYRLARLLWQEYEILPHFSYVIGHPVETLDQVQKTLDLHEAVCDLVGAPTGELGFYNPVLGTPFLHAHQELFDLPDTLEGWARFNYYTQDLYREPSPELTRKLFQHHIKVRRKFPGVEAFKAFDVWQERYRKPPRSRTPESGRVEDLVAR